MLDILTPQSLWSGYSDTESELNERLVHKYEEDDCVFSEVYFDGVKGEKAYTRVFANVAYPSDATELSVLPLMLIIDGVERNADKDLIKYWVQKGYIVIAPDYCGGNGLKTIYPSELFYCNYTESGRRYTHVDTNARETCWYNWAYCMRRALTYAEHIFGCSNMYVYGRYEGVRLALMLLGVDSRLKAGALLFGCLWEDVLDDDSSILSEDGFPDLKKQIEQEDEHERRLAGISPQTYADIIKQPIMIVQGTNSVNADIIKNYDVSFRMHNVFGSNFVYLPRMTEGYSEDTDDRIARWFKSPFAPKQIDIKAEVKDGKLIARVDLIKLDRFEKVSVYYSRGEVAQCVRNWLEANESVMLMDDYLATLEVVNLEEPIYFFAYVETEDQVFSSKIVKVVPSQMGVTETVETTKLIYKGKWGTGGFVPLDPEKPQSSSFVRNNPISVASGAFNVTGVKGRAIATYALNDSKICKNNDSTLTLDVYSQKEQVLKIYYVEGRGMDEQKIFLALIDLVGGELWQKVSVTVDDYKCISGTGSQPKEGVKQTLLAFVAEDDVILNNILYT